MTTPSDKLLSMLATTHPGRLLRLRRLVLRGGALAIAAALLAIAYVDTNYPRLHEVTVPVPGLSRPVEVLQVSDLGSARFGAKQSGLAALIEGRKYDSIVMTGDIGGEPDSTPIWELVDALKKHSDSIWFIRGNHDWPSIGEGLAARGVPSLPASAPVALAEGVLGVEEAALVYGRSSATIATAEGTGKQLLVIASHTPPDRHRLAAGLALEPGTHLYIAGHTHGGQVRLPFVGAIGAPLSWPAEERDPARGNEITFLPELKGRFVDGMYVRDGQRIFVSRGLDVNTGRFRFLCRAEIIAFHFVPAPAE
jgi:uncharacterized protein